MSSKDFLEPRFTGPRFEEHSIPMEFLADLAALEGLLIEVARAEFFKDNPERKRLPRKFLEGTSLSLSGIRDGSAVPIIKLVAGTSLLFSRGQDYFEQARDLVITAMAAAESNQPTISNLPERALSYFDRFGQSLREGEAIEFSSPGSNQTVRFTKATRRRLVWSNTNAIEVTEQAAIFGRVPEADQDRDTFQIQLADGRKLSAPMAPEYREVIIDAFNKYSSGAKIRLEGLGKVNRAGQMKRIVGIDNVTLLDDLDVAARLDELKTLKEGWFDGEGVIPPIDELDWLAGAFDSYYQLNERLPHIYVLEDGLVRAEWTLAGYEASLEINLQRHSGKWHAWKVGTKTEECFDVLLDNPEDWKRIEGQLRRFLGEG